MSETTDWADLLFDQPLLDLGEHEKPDFAGVVSPRDEVGTTRHGVNAVFLEDAEAYYAKYQGFNYWRDMLDLVLAELKLPAPEVIVEYGCGFGNATLPMLDLFPAARLLASDISPNLLAILHRLLGPRGLAGRCLPVAMDALKPYVREASADLVFGAAILHHLTRPEDFVASAMRVLKPGGIAFFFEPLEGGYAVLLHLIEELRREAARRRSLPPLRLPTRLGKRIAGRFNRQFDTTQHLADCLERQAVDLRPMVFRGGPGWAERDDKWAFPRSKLDAMARAAGADARVIPLHDQQGPFRRQLLYMLETYHGIPPARVPGWALAVMDRYDQEVFSPEGLVDVALEGCVVFQKR